MGLAIESKIISYQEGDTELLGLFHYHKDDQKRPCILIAHTWEGRGSFVEQIGQRIAELGYNAFALDMYGSGETASEMAACEALMQPFVDDRQLLSRRVNAALNCAKNQAENDAAKIIAIGYCFGGMCVLDLARSNADLLGVVSFHGLLKAPSANHASNIKAKILVLNGNDDPMVPVTDVNALGEELTKAKADWQIHNYSNTLHAFTNKQANAPGVAMYNADADKRSWQSMKNFIEELF